MNPYQAALESEDIINDSGPKVKRSIEIPPSEPAEQPGQSQALPDPTGKENYLSQFPTERRGVVVNHFLHWIRRGLTDPEGIVAAIQITLEKDLSGCRALTRRLKIRSVLSTLDQPEARECAAWYVAYEQLSPTEKARLKAHRAEEGIRVWMASQEATSKQIAYLRALGWEGPVGNRAEASTLIDRMLCQRRSSHG